MTDLLEKAIDKLKALDPERQDEIARILLTLTDDADDDLTPEELKAIAISDTEIARGEFASDQEIAVIWAKHGL